MRSSLTPAIFRGGVAHFLPGLEVLDPAVVLRIDWMPGLDPRPEAPAEDVAFYAAVARRP